MEYRHDDLYCDRTWFDELGERLMRQLRRRGPRNRADLWTWGFALFSTLCVGWAAALATQSVLFDLPANERLAQILAAALLLVAARHFLRATAVSAKSALPRYARLVRTSSPTVTEAGRVACDPSATRRMAGERRVANTEAQAFFRALRSAGINVRSARALYSAGFRNAEQVRGCADARLLAVPGVGQATLRKLRLQFGLPSSAFTPERGSTLA